MFRRAAFLAAILLAVPPSRPWAAEGPKAYPNPAQAGAEISFMAAAVPGGLYAWEFGDFSPATGFDTASAVVHRYALPGRYAVLARTLQGGIQKSATFFVLVHPALPARRPTASGSILIDGTRRRVWTVNPDHGTVACLDADKLEPILEAKVGDHPQSLAQAPDGTLWVANRGDASISLLDPVSGSRIASVKLPFASAPSGIVFPPGGSAVYVALEAAGKVVRIDPATRGIVASVPVPPHPRGLALDPDGRRVLVAHFISQGYQGMVTELDAATLAPLRSISLGEDLTPDAENAGRGSPNHLAAIALSPDGTQAWIPAKKDNLRRGQARDGKALDFQSTVRAMVARIDVASGREQASLRLDIDDSEGPCAVAFGPFGFPAFIAFRGSEKVMAWDPFDNARLTTMPEVGAAPMGLAVDSATGRLFVQAFLSREVSVFDASGLVFGGGTLAPLLKRIPTASTEPLSPEALRGKRIFNTTTDIRMSKDGYLSCASCHAEGGSDGRIWDFTDRGEGLRSTVPLFGRAKQGPLHWSGNFDEMQDFENDIRGPFGGSGFLPEAVFRAGTRGSPLGDKKAGLSPELDALAAYVASLDKVPPSPWRNQDGTLTEAARRGKGIFFREDVGCVRCHALPDYSDSRLPGPEAKGPSSGAPSAGAPASSAPFPGDGITAEGFPIHDVGTLKPASGKRLGGNLAGLDTPGLKGLWDTAPYLHDGSAATLEDVLVAANPEDRHGRTGGLTAGERSDLIAFLNQLDDLDDEGRPQAIVHRDGRELDGPLRMVLEPRSGGVWRVLLEGAPGRVFTIRVCDAEGGRLGSDAAVTAGPDGTATWAWDGKRGADRHRSPSFIHACSGNRCRTLLLPFGGMRAR
jgi:YVTN family beta-propeller protein